MKSRLRRWTIGFAVAAAALVAVRVTLAFIATPPRDDPPVATHGGDVYGDPLPEGAVARLGTIRFRGKGPAVWAPDGDHLFVGGWNDEILAMNAKTGLVDWTLPGHSQPFMRNIEMTDLDEMWRVIRRGEVPLEDDALSGLTMFPDGRRLLSQGYSLRIWDLPLRAELKVIPLRGGTVSGGRISPDGTLYAFAWIDCVRIVDLVAGRERRRARVGWSEGKDQNQVQCVAWSGDGARVFAGLQDGRIAVVSTEPAPPVYFRLSDCAIDALLVVDKGRSLWTLDHDGVVTVRSLASPNAAPRRIELGVDDDPKKRWWRGTLTASSDGRVVAATHGKMNVRWLDAATAEPIDGPSPGAPSSPIGWSSDGRRFAAWSQGAIRIVGADAPTQPDTTAGQVGDTAWSPDGRFVATTSYHYWDEPSICAWDAATGRRVWTFACEPWWWQSRVAWSADGAEVVASFASRVIGLDAATGARRWTFEIPAKRAAWPSLSPRGEGAMWVDDARDLHVVDLRGRPHEVGVVHLGTKPATDRPHAALLPDLSAVVLLENVPTEVRADGSWTGRLRVRTWRIGASAPAVEVDAFGSGLLAATRDGRFAAAGDTQVVVFDLAATPPREIGRVKLERKSTDHEWCSFTTAAFSLDGSSLALGDERGVVHVYSMQELAEVKTFRGHRAQITSLAFSDDGSRLVSGSADATALVWTVR